MEQATLLYLLGLLLKVVAVYFIIKFAIKCVLHLIKYCLGVHISVKGYLRLFKLQTIESIEIKTKTAELQVNNIFLSLRWLDSSCRHFFKVNINGIHLEYTKMATSVKPSSSTKNNAPSRKKRLFHWCLRKLCKCSELYVKCIEVVAKDNTTPDLAPTILLNIGGQFSLIAKPRRKDELVVSVNIEKLTSELIVQTDTPCTYTEDGLYPLAEMRFSAKTVLILQPLSQNEGLVKSVQLNVLPLETLVQNQDVLNKLIAKYRQSSVSDGNSESLLAKLPQKVEVVLEAVNLLYQAQGTTRVLSNKLTRASLDASLSTRTGRELPAVNCALGLQDMVVTDSKNRRAVKLQQLRLVSTLNSDGLSNKLSLESPHLNLWEEEVIFWAQYTKQFLSNNSLDKDTKSLNLVSQLHKFPLSVVTSLESSDWSLQLQTDTPTLQAKEPLCCVAMATFIGNVQWSQAESTTIPIKWSLRLSDLYLHVPGYHPTMDNPTFYRQRTDNPQALPSNHTHLWGRVLSLGTLVLQSQEGVWLSSERLSCNNLKISGKGSSLMMEWSKPTVVALVRLLHYLRTEYGVCPGGPDRDKSSEGLATEQEPDSLAQNSEKESDSLASEIRQKTGGLVKLELELELTDINIFMYALTPEPPSVMIRLDAGSLSTTPTITLALHRLLIDDMHHSSFSQVFLCSDTANLPLGSGVVCLDSTVITYDQDIQDVGVAMCGADVKWSTTAHKCIHRVVNHMMEDSHLIKCVLEIGKPQSAAKPVPDELVVIGDRMKGIVERVPVTVSGSIDKTSITAVLDRRTRVTLNTTNVQYSLAGGVALASSQDLLVNFDNHPIISLTELIARFPQEVSTNHRAALKYSLERGTNPVLWLQASRANFIFPYDYNFSLTYDKLTNVRKFLQKIHSGTSRSSTQRYLPPDLYVECEDILVQINDDPFEIKLRTNYELLCDEFEQKTQRREALNGKLDQIRQEQGLTAVSGENIQSLYNSLEAKDSEIYCQRAHTLYNTTEEPLPRTGLFMFTMEHSKLTFMSDPSLLGEDNLTKNLLEMDKENPLPEGYSFSTLFGFYVSGSTDKLQMQIRDYPSPLLAITEVLATGKLVLAEQEAKDREVRSGVVEVGHPWSNVTIKRKLPPVKYYYDLQLRTETWDMEYGPCMEPGMAQTNIGFGKLTSPTVDPSRPLPYWDKLRLLFHGPISVASNEMRVLLPATFNPYNNVEYLEIRMNNLDLLLLTTTQLNINSGLKLIMHTASKYDDCTVLSVPSVKLQLNLNWVCSGKGHHSHHHVTRCAPDRVPVLPDNQVHDSYSCFRSTNMDIDCSLDIQPQGPADAGLPSIELYSSTLRCLQQYQALHKWNVTRPTRRGVYFKNLKPRRSPLLRHCRDVKARVSFPRTVLHYWSSAALQKGVECTLEEASLAVTYLLKLIPKESGLTQRPLANWTIVSCQGKIRNMEAFVKEADGNLDNETAPVGDVRHTRSMLCSLEELVYSTQETQNEQEDFTHQLQTQNTKLLWNMSNKNVVLGLYDAFNQAQMLKRDLSTEPLKLISRPLPQEVLPSAEPLDEGHVTNTTPTRPSSGRIRQPSSGNTMLDQLLADISNTFVSYVDERAPSDPLLKGVAAGSMNDVKRRNWNITLTNTQIALQGPESNGYALASSHVAQVFGRDHHPQLKDGEFIVKKSWVGKIQELQYFSTVSPELEEGANIPWLPLSVICPPLALTVKHPDQEQPATHDHEASLNILLGKLGPSESNDTGRVGTGSPPGEAVGGLVSSTLSDPEQRANIQLQRIATRCHCQVFYVTYGDVVVDSSDLTLQPGSPRGPNINPSEAVDTLTVRYPSVEVCTTSSQYTLIMDILNNLLLNKEAKRKEKLDRKARMQFTLQLANIQDPRKHMQAQQNKVRTCLQKLKQLQTQLFLEQREDKRSDIRIEDLFTTIASAKEELAASSITLRAMIKAFKHNQLYLSPSGPSETEPAEPVRRVEIWVDDAHWWLTQDDGQLQVADICFTNFSYNRVTFNDDSGEHRFELGTFMVKNLMPNTRGTYQNVLHPYDPNSKHLRVDKNICLRVYCKDKAPVAGISVKEHLEVNVVPLSVSLTAKFYQTIQDFFFPKADENEQQEADHTHLFGPSGAPLPPSESDRASPMLLRSSSIRHSTMSINSGTTTITGHSPPTSPTPKEMMSGRSLKHKTTPTVDAVERMKERATNTQTFLYVKIPKCALCVNYKGENVSIKDIQNGRFTIPTLEYHNKNWTWGNMLMEVKKDIKTVIVQQTLKSVVGMKETDEKAGLDSPKMARKGDWGADMLLGSLQAKVAKGSKKLFGKLASSEGDSEQKKSPGASYMPPLSEHPNRTNNS